MKKHKLTRIQTETTEIFILRRGAAAPERTAFCRDCAADAEMLDFDSAAALFRPGGGLLLVGQIEAGAVHAFETTRGQLLVCRNSLRKFMQKK